ncbi:MAG: hypothetical protein KAZ48_03855, partial [Candidatus Nanopelagicales bacterium]|nr:hypothetical protein [Candidatus Nanopelagicales bacterium]
PQSFAPGFHVLGIAPSVNWVASHPAAASPELIVDVGALARAVAAPVVGADAAAGGAASSPTARVADKAVKATKREERVVRARM